MKVSKLIAELLKMDQDLEVIIQHDENNGYFGVDEVKEIKEEGEAMVSINWHE